MNNNFKTELMLNTADIKPDIKLNEFKNTEPPARKNRK